MEHPWVRVIDNYSQTETIPVTLRLNIATVIALPPEEKIRSIVNGNEDAFKVAFNREHNSFSVKPTTENIRETSIHATSMTGHIYTFWLVVANGNTAPDLKVIVKPSAQLAEELKSAPRYIPDTDVTQMREDAALWRQDAKQCRLDLIQAKADGDAAVKRAIVTTAIKTAGKPPIRYQFKQKEAPFNIKNIWGDPDNGITRIEAHPHKQYALLEYDGDKPHVVIPDCADDVCTVAHPITRGRLVIDKRSTEFYQVP